MAHDIIIEGAHVKHVDEVHTWAKNLPEALLPEADRPITKKDLRPLLDRAGVADSSKPTPQARPGEVKAAQPTDDKHFGDQREDSAGNLLPPGAHDEMKADDEAVAQKREMYLKNMNMKSDVHPDANHELGTDHTGIPVLLEGSSAEGTANVERAFAVDPAAHSTEFTPGHEFNQPSQ